MPTKFPSRSPYKDALDEQRHELLRELEEWLEVPTTTLSFVWLVLTVFSFLESLSRFWQSVQNLIWAVFILNFGVQFTLAPDKIAYLRRSWLTALSLLLPALRVFRVLRFLRLFRVSGLVTGGAGLALVRLLTSLNRGMRALRATTHKRGISYVLALTTGVVFVGAAGMYAFEQSAPGGPGFKSYADALWWTAMLLTTLGSAYWPVTPEGRVLCFLLSLYGFTVFGYVTATLATFFIGRDAEETANRVSSKTPS